MKGKCLRVNVGKTKDMQLLENKRSVSTKIDSCSYFPVITENLF